MFQTKIFLKPSLHCMRLFVVLFVAWPTSLRVLPNLSALVRLELAAPVAFAQDRFKSNGSTVVLPWITLLEKDRKEVKAGLILYQRFENLVKDEAEIARLPNGALKRVVHIVTIQLKSKALSLSLSAEADKGLTPSEFHLRQKALVTVNGSFFDEKNHALGLTISNGKRWKHTQDSEGYAFFACSKELNCLVEPSAKADPQKQGLQSLKNSSFNDSNTFFQAVSGRPRLIDAGVPRSRELDQKCAQFCETRHPRVGIGLSQNREVLYIALAEGRQSQVEGCSLAEFSSIMQFFGAFDAVNLDGGGSATLLIEGKRVSGRPTNEPLERPVANALSIY